MGPWYLSKTTWALVAAVIGAIGEVVGVKLDPDQLSSLITYLTDAGQIIAIVAPIVAAILHRKSTKKAAQAVADAQVENAPPSTKP